MAKTTSFMPVCDTLPGLRKLRRTVKAGAPAILKGDTVGTKADGSIGVGGAVGVGHPYFKALVDVPTSATDTETEVYVGAFYVPNAGGTFYTLAKLGKEVSFTSNEAIALTDGTSTHILGFDPVHGILVGHGLQLPSV